MHMCRRGCIVSSLDYFNLRKHAMTLHEESAASKWDKREVLAENPEWAPVFEKNTKLILNVPPLLASFIPSCPNRAERISGYKCDHCGDVQDSLRKSRQHLKLQQNLKTPCPLHVGREASITSDVIDCVKIRHTCR